MSDYVFKAKRANGEWDEGNLFIGENGTYEMGVGTPEHRTWWNVDPKTVCRFTELTDKNGVRIFEGDILHCVSQLDDSNMVVIYENGEFRLVPCERYRSYTENCGYFAIRCFVKDVIGNIFDNPELLGGYKE